MDKVCFKCGKIKSIDEFYKHPKRSRGFDLKYKEAHHWDYDCLKSGFILSRRAHKLIHKYLKLDNENRFFFYGENLLDTKEKHRIFMDKIFEINNVDYKYVEFDL